MIIGVVLLGGLAGLVVKVAGTDSPAAGGNASSPGMAPGSEQPEESSPGTSGATVCDRYEVTAETLAIRLHDGRQTGEYLAKGSIVTVQGRSGPAGAKYWYVAGADGREGWVLPSTRYWRRSC